VITYLELYPLLTAACPGYEEERHRTEHLPALFGVVEWVLEEGDEEARSLITDGFFDDLTNSAFYRRDTVQPADFVPWLGPHAARLVAVRRLTEPPPS
jgi:hypothetical protein